MSLYVSHISMLPIELWAQRFHLPLKPSIIQDEPCGNLRWNGWEPFSSPKISGGNLLNFFCRLFTRPSLPGPCQRPLQPANAQSWPGESQIKTRGTAVLCFTEVSQRQHQIQPGDMTPACSQLQGRWPTHAAWQHGSESNLNRNNFGLELSTELAEHHKWGP